MNLNQVPELSVILPTADNYSTIRRTVHALHAQTVRDRIELVIVSPTDDPGVVPADVTGFASVMIVNGGPLRTSNISRAAGIRAASAPIVALAEDHCFPDPDWAIALIEAHRGDWAVVGPVLRNANPRSMTSWANLLLEYYPWVEGAKRAELNDLPGHNSAYRKDLLLAYGDRLEGLFEVEAVIQRDLREKGHRMLLEPKARTNDLNFSRLSSALYLRFHAGRSFAGHRTMGWSCRQTRWIHTRLAPHPDCSIRADRSNGARIPDIFVALSKSAANACPDVASGRTRRACRLCHRSRRRGTNSRRDRIQSRALHE